MVHISMVNDAWSHKPICSWGGTILHWLVIQTSHQPNQTLKSPQNMAYSLCLKICDHQMDESVNMVYFLKQVPYFNKYSMGFCTIFIDTPRS